MIPRGDSAFVWHVLVLESILDDRQYPPPSQLDYPSVMLARSRSMTTQDSPAPPKASHKRLSNFYLLLQLPSSLPSCRPLLFRSRRSVVPAGRRRVSALLTKLRGNGSWPLGCVRRIDLSMQTSRKTVVASVQGALDATHVHFHVLGCSASQDAKYLSDSVACWRDAEMSGSVFLVDSWLVAPLQTYMRKVS